MKSILLSTLATREPGVHGSGCRPPGRLRRDSLMEIESPGRSRQVSLPRIGSLGKSRHVDLLAPLDCRIPKQAEAWQPPKDQTPKRVEAG